MDERSRPDVIQCLVSMLIGLLDVLMADLKKTAGGAVPSTIMTHGRELTNGAMYDFTGKLLHFATMTVENQCAVK
jgi:hypothetical protein